MSPRRQARAHVNGTSPCRSAASTAASAICLERSAKPALQNAAASTTSDFTACRTEPSWAADATARSAWPTAAAPCPGEHRQLGAHPREPHRQSRGRGLVDDVPGARQQPRREREPPDSECVCGQPDQRIGARVGVAARDRQGAAIPAARIDVPSELPQERRSGAEGERRDGAARCPVDGVELGQCDGVSALTACGDGAVPVLFDRARRRQRPAPRVRTEGCVGHGVHRLGTLSTVKITSSLFKITTARPRY